MMSVWGQNMSVGSQQRLYTALAYMGGSLPRHIWTEPHANTDA